jgi:signal peptidase II
MTRLIAAVAMGHPALPFGLVAILAVFAIDQCTKQLVIAALSRGNVLSLTSFFDLRLSFNEGVSFGMFADRFAGLPIILAGITLAIIILLALVLIRSHTRWEAIALGTIIGGALGNVLDRLRIGAVVDFLDFHLWHYHWLAFNLADAAIIIGIAMLVLTSFARPAGGQPTSPVS